MDVLSTVIISLLAALGALYLSSAVAALVFARELSQTVTVVSARELRKPTGRYLLRLLAPRSRVVAVSSNPPKSGEGGISYYELAAEVRKTLERSG